MIGLVRQEEVMRVIKRMAIIDTRKVKPGDKYLLLFDMDVEVSVIMFDGEIRKRCENIKSGTQFLVSSCDNMAGIVRFMPLLLNSFLCRLKGFIDKRNISICFVYFSTDVIEQSMRKIK